MTSISVSYVVPGQLTKVTKISDFSARPQLGYQLTMERHAMQKGSHGSVSVLPDRCRNPWDSVLGVDLAFVKAL
jgi:hypothetical protein